MRKVLAAMAIATTIGLLACSTPQSRRSDASDSLAYEPPAPVVRTPLLPPPAGYAAAPPSSWSNGQFLNAAEAAQLGWHASPRWTEIKGEDALVDCDAACRDPHAKFKAAKSKATKVGVENLSEDDVKGLTPAQLRELRGY